MSLGINLLVAFLACLSGMCLSVAGEKADVPSLRLACRESELMAARDKRVPLSADWRLMLSLEPENASSWNIVWCETDRNRVTVEDSFGNRTTRVSFYCDGAGKKLTLLSAMLPGVGARWVRVKGDVALAVSRLDAVTEPVTVKLVKGFSVPVALKGAGLAGGDDKPVDVQATLKVREYQESREQGGPLLQLELDAGKRLKLRAFELQAMNGQPVTAVMEECSCSDRVQLRLTNGVPEGELKVILRYAGNPCLVMAGVDSGVALSGLIGRAGEGKARLADQGKTAGRHKGVEPGTLPAATGGELIRAELSGLSIGTGGNMTGEAAADWLKFEVRLTIEKPVDFSISDGFDIQSLGVTDSTGRALKPAMFNMEHMGRAFIGFPGKGFEYSYVSGRSLGLASPGAEWVRLQGTLRVPVVRVKESPVYELPLAKGSEQMFPVPGMEETADDPDDVATVDKAPACRLSLERVEFGKNRELRADVLLVVESLPFYWEEFVVVDEQGEPVQAEIGGGYMFRYPEKWGWLREVRLKNAVDMKQLRIRLKYRETGKTVPVPVDVKVGLGGPVSRKADGVGRSENAGKEKR